jgi:crotonobetainyl-CoA:carnitine CoA-transferase CaiB-like acyl-CoA transferase
MAANGRPSVLDLTDRAAAYAARLLVDLGAGVIRVDGPDRARGRHPDRWLDAGKRSIGLDLRASQAVEVLARLCAAVDVVVDGMDPAFAQTDAVYERCRAANPRLTWVAIRPLAADARGAGAKSAEIVRYAQSGLMSITGMPDAPPVLVGGGLADAVTATFGALACLLGYRAARQSGAGRLVRVSAHEALSLLMQQGLYEAAFSGRVTRRGGHRHAHIAAAGALECRDGYVVVSANERRMWSALVEMVGDDRLRDEALTDERVRLERQGEIFDILGTWARRFSKADLAEMAQARGIPAAPVHDLDDLERDPQLRARGFFQPTDGEDMPVLVTPWRRRHEAAPRPGAHTEAVLTEAGFSREEIARLRAAGAVYGAAVPIHSSGAGA